jgi:hypothetical protein
MAAKYILAVVAAAFLAMALVRALFDQGFSVQTKSWMLVGAIFAAVSTWLFW